MVLEAEFVQSNWLAKMCRESFSQGYGLRYQPHSLLNIIRDYPKPRPDSVYLLWLAPRRLCFRECEEQGRLARQPPLLCARPGAKARRTLSHHRQATQATASFVSRTKV